ncbi:ESX secretion-associated protein EspG [Actinocrispum wychmicini]|uniref:ESX secretion-associated protein EspG n=1 Tax=Actinocrispum wychmicini TaxID=1213861 RepID=UPI00312C72CB
MLGFAIGAVVAASASMYPEAEAVRVVERFDPTDPAGTRPDEVHFGLIELGLLATHAGVRVPYPLRAPSFEPAAAGSMLRARGLADDSGPVGAAAELATALRNHRSAVDLVLIDPQGTVGAVALPHNTSALICSQRLGNGRTGSVRVRRVTDASLTRELLGIVPAVPAAVSMPIALPPSVVESADDTPDERRLRAAVRESGGDPDVLDRLAELLPTVTGRGQLGATGHTGVRTELSWLDGPRGRLRVDRVDGWVSVNPLRRTDLLCTLAGLAAAVGDGQPTW